MSSNTKKYAWVHVQMDSPKSFFTPYRNLSEAKKCYESFDKIIFVSKFLEDSFLSKTRWLSLNTQVIYNTVDVSKIVNLSREETDFYIKKDILNLCSIGRLVKQKGYDRLLNVLLKLKNEGYKFHFYLLGDGEMASQLMKFCDNNDLTEFITFCGYQENPYSIISKMDLFICSSRKEGFSTAVTESILLNIPVLTTDCSGMKELLQNGLYGMIVDNSEDALYDGLKKIMNNLSILTEYRLQIEKSFKVNDSINEVEKLLDL